MKIYYSTSIFYLFFLTCFSVNAQDIDTLDWEEIVELTDTIFNENLDTIYLINDSIAEGESFRTGSSTACITSSAAFSIK